MGLGVPAALPRTPAASALTRLVPYLREPCNANGRGVARPLGSSARHRRGASIVNDEPMKSALLCAILPRVFFEELRFSRARQPLSRNDRVWRCVDVRRGCA